MIKWIISLFWKEEVKTSSTVKLTVFDRNKAILKVAHKHFEASKRLKV